MYLQAQVLYLTNLDRAGLAGKDELDRLAALKVQLDAAKKAQEGLAAGTQAAADALTTKLTPSAQPQAAAPSVSSVFNIVLLSGDKNAVDQLGDLVARRRKQQRLPSQACSTSSC